jgi:UDP-GlcNAc:undecaprenyl-phosphate GlcNAc-1-phosphate transferase
MGNCLGISEPFWLGFVASVVVSALIVASVRWHVRWTSDSSEGPQKLHTGSVPRVGGVAIFAGVAAAFVGSSMLTSPTRGMLQPIALVAALLVPFVAGLYEDVTKKFGATARLIATFIAAIIAFYLCDAAIVRFDMPLLDALLSTVPLASLLFTMFCVGGVAHAFNLSDGLNGLLGGLTIGACVVLAYSANSLGDTMIFALAVAVAGATTGFLVFNFPKARLFAGDSGAYVVGTATALLAILLVARNPVANPWLAFVAVIYPFTDATCAIARRIVRRKPIMSPDAEHLHSLLVKRVSALPRERAHAVASLAIVGTTFAFQAVALMFPHSVQAAVVTSFAFGVTYLCVWLTLWRATQRDNADEVTRPLAN